MPSGSYVVVRSYNGWYSRRPSLYLNIYVYPMTVDAYHTTGLCGNYNLNPGDDIPYRECKADCEPYRHEAV